jgi:hypothetical protein
LQKLSTSIDEGEDTESTHNEPYAAHGRKPAVKIRDLKKVYPGGKVAVENLSLEVYEDHITALLERVLLYPCSLASLDQPVEMLIYGVTAYAIT